MKKYMWLWLTTVCNLKYNMRDKILKQVTQKNDLYLNIKESEIV